MGLKLAEQVGEENLDLYMCLDSKLMKVCTGDVIESHLSCFITSLPLLSPKNCFLVV